MKPPGIAHYQWWLYNYYFLAGNYLGQKLSRNYFGPKKSRLFEKITQNPGMKERGGQIPTQQIECDDIAPYLSNKKLLEAQPLIFRGKAKNWPCISKWTESFFEERLGTYQADIIDNIGLSSEGTVFTETNMATYIKELKKDKNNYLRFCRIIDHHPELKEDLDTGFINQFKCPDARGDAFNLFMGESGTKTEMHTALPSTLFVQVKGQKKWTLYAPEERIFLDPVADRMPYLYSKADPNEMFNPNFPLLQYARYYQFILEEGDVLWFPPFFFHYVENPTASLGVAFKYTSNAQALRLSKVCTWLYYTATNPSLISSFLHNRKYNRDLLYSRKKTKIPKAR